MIDSPPEAPALLIARGSASDLDDVMSVMTAAFDPAYGEGWTRSQCAGILPISGVSLLLARDSRGEPVGFSLFRTVMDEAELLLLAVKPARQRSGIGQRLLHRFVESARAQGARRVHLEVRDGNPAVHMYRSAGFAPAGRRRNYYHGQAGEQFDALTLAREI